MAIKAHPLKGVIAALAAAVLLLIAGLPVHAASGSTFSIRQTFNVTGEAPKNLDKTGTYTLTAIDGAPLPGGQTGGSMTITLNGDQEKDYNLTVNAASADSSSINFTTAGVYTYTVTPTTKAANSRYTLDTRAYTVRIYVANTANGGLTVEKVICIDPNNEKSDGVVYHHTYKGPAPVTPAQTTSQGRVKTGDTTSIAIWVSALGAAALLLILVGVRRRENQDADGTAE